MGPFDKTNDPKRSQNPQRYSSIEPLKHGLRNKNIRNVYTEDPDPTETTKLLPDRESSDSSRQSSEDEDNGDRLAKVNGQTVDEETSTDIEPTSGDMDYDTDADSLYNDVRAAVSREDDPEMACVS